MSGSFSLASYRAYTISWHTFRNLLSRGTANKGVSKKGWFSLRSSSLWFLNGRTFHFKLHCSDRGMHKHIYSGSHRTTTAEQCIALLNLSGWLTTSIPRTLPLSQTSSTPQPICTMHHAPCSMIWLTTTQQPSCSSFDQGMHSIYRHKQKGLAVIQVQMQG